MPWLTRVRSHSMAPTLRDGQLVPTRSLRRGTPARGDLVVVDHARAGRRIIKRVVGLPGETVVLDGGVVSVDGVPLPEPYAGRSWFSGRFQVPAGHYFLLGDNRDASSDGRTWAQPYVARSEIVGRVVGVGSWVSVGFAAVLARAAG